MSTETPDSSYIYTTNSENDLKIGRADLPQLVIEIKPHQKGWGGGGQTYEPNPQHDYKQKDHHKHR